MGVYAWLSMVLFYWKGKYSHWLYRLLKVKLVAAQGTEGIPASRADTEEVDRTFVWRELYLALLSLMEAVQLHQLVNTLGCIFPAADPDAISVLPIPTANSCAICRDQSAKMPVRDRSHMCSHVFCYYCAQSRLISSAGSFLCPICQSMITTVESCCMNK